MNQSDGNLSPILTDPAILAGKPHIRATSLSVEFLQGLLATGWTREKILDVYQYLIPQEVDAVTAFPENPPKVAQNLALPDRGLLKAA